MIPGDAICINGYLLRYLGQSHATLCLGRSSGEGRNVNQIKKVAATPRLRPYESFCVKVSCSQQQGRGIWFKRPVAPGRGSRSERASERGPLLPPPLDWPEKKKETTTGGRAGTTSRPFHSPMHRTPLDYRGFGGVQAWTWQPGLAGLPCAGACRTSTDRDIPHRPGQNP